MKFTKKCHREMRIHILLLLCLLFGEIACAEEVEVVEAIPSSKTDEGHNEKSSLNRQDAEVETSNELSLDSLGENDKEALPSSNHRNQVSQSVAPSRSNAPSLFHNRPSDYHNVAYHGPPPPLPGETQLDSIDKIFTTGSGSSVVENWPSDLSDMPKIISLDVKCEKNSMKVYLSFDKPFYGIIFSKGHYSNINCVHLPAGHGRSSVNFEIGIHACGTAGNTENGLYGYGADSGSGTYFENIIVIQYDPQVQEVWDQARKLRCTWHDLYEKSVTFRPFPVDMLDVVRADFAGDNVGCWMQIQVGKGPWASEVSGLVKIGQTMTMVLAIKDDDSKFDMLVRNCMAHDGKRAPIQLVDQKGCIIRPKLISRFTKIKNFGASASVLSYAHFQAFKFPDSMEVHFQCTIQICRYHCPNQCAEQTSLLELENHARQPDGSYGIVPQLHLPLETYIQSGHPRDERRRKSRQVTKTAPEKSIGVNRVIRVVSSGDLTFPIDESADDVQESTMVFPVKEATGLNVICITTSGFTVTLLLLLMALITSSGLSIYFCIRVRNQRIKKNDTVVVYENKSVTKKNAESASFYS